MKRPSDDGVKDKCDVAETELSGVQESFRQGPADGLQEENIFSESTAVWELYGRNWTQGDYSPVAKVASVVGRTFRQHQHGTQSSSLPAGRSREMLKYLDEQLQEIGRAVK
jgi:hypothetical protein